MAELKASEQGKKIIQEARNRIGWKVDDPKWLIEASKILEPERNWEEDSHPYANGVSEGTWRAFLYNTRKKGIATNVFKAYCQVLGVAWKDVAEKKELSTDDVLKDLKKQVLAVTNPINTKSPEKLPSFVGREQEIRDINRLVSEGAKIICIKAEDGTGKTALAREWFRVNDLEYLELCVGSGLASVESVQSWIQRNLNTHFSELRDSIEELKLRLKDNTIGILIDNLDTITVNGEIIQEYRDSYLELLKTLSDSSLQVVTIVTIQESISEPRLMSQSEVIEYPLKGLCTEEWYLYFKNHNITINDTKNLEQINQAYGGNAEAMILLESDIRIYAENNLDGYWQEYKDDLLLNPGLRNLIKRQLKKLKANYPNGYRLLKRFANYTYEQRFVPEAWLYCLLWDVNKTRRKRIIKTVKDSNFVKYHDGFCSLNNAIAQELKEQIYFKGDKIYFLIKAEIDSYLKDVPNIQKMLSEINDRFDSIHIYSNKGYFRSYYIWELILEVLHEYEGRKPILETLLVGEKMQLDQKIVLFDQKIEIFGEETGSCQAEIFGKYLNILTDKFVEIINNMNNFQKEIDGKDFILTFQEELSNLHSDCFEKINRYLGENMDSVFDTYLEYTLYMSSDEDFYIYIKDNKQFCSMRRQHFSKGFMHSFLQNIEAGFSFRVMKLVEEMERFLKFLNNIIKAKRLQNNGKKRNKDYLKPSFTFELAVPEYSSIYTEERRKSKRIEYLPDRHLEVTKKYIKELQEYYWINKILIECVSHGETDNQTEEIISLLFLPNSQQ